MGFSGVTCPRNFELMLKEILAIRIRLQRRYGVAPILVRAKGSRR